MTKYELHNEADAPGLIGWLDWAISAFVFAVVVAILMGGSEDE